MRLACDIAAAVAMTYVLHMFSGSLSFVVTGAAFKTARTYGRHAEIGISAPGDALTLRRDPGMIGHQPTIGVYTARARQIGYIQPHEVDFILPDIAKAEAIFQSGETFGAVSRITLDGSKPTLPQPKPKPQLRLPPAEPRDEYVGIFANANREGGRAQRTPAYSGKNAEGRRGPWVNKCKTCRKID